MLKIRNIIFIIPALILLFSCAKNNNSIPEKYKEYEKLLEPGVNNLPDKNMLVVRGEGNPDIVGPKAFKVLYQVYFKLKGVDKNFKNSTPRARWDINTDEIHNKENFIGYYALPISDVIRSLPNNTHKLEMNIEIKTWKYGETAEILHTGDYDSEAQTIDKLIKYIEENGYKITGLHEEVYIKGPGMFGKGNPDKYLTIIRYPVSKENDDQ